MYTTPLLSVCIPTYNRSDYLSKGLISVAGQIDSENLPLVELVISDNASTDKTPGVVSEFVAQHPELRVSYHRNEKNLGIDANIYAVIKLAVGTFVFMLSDDDILLPGALSRIIKQIMESPQIDAICPNFQASAQVEHETTLPWLILDRDRVINSKDDSLSILGTLLTYLSCLIFRKDLVADKDYNDRVGTFLLCSYLFVDVIKASQQSLVFKKPCLAARPNHSLSYDMIRVFVSEFARVLEYAGKNGFSDHVRRTVLSSHARWLVGSIYHYKKTSYRPNLLRRSKDTARVLSVWWCDLRALLRVEAAIWLPPQVSNRLVALLRVFRSAHYR